MERFRKEFLEGRVVDEVREDDPQDGDATEAVDEKEALTGGGWGEVFHLHRAILEIQGLQTKLRQSFCKPKQTKRGNGNA